MTGFPRQSRLLTAGDFKNVLGQRPAVRGRFFAVHRLQRPSRAEDGDSAPGVSPERNALSDAGRSEPCPEVPAAGTCLGSVTCSGPRLGLVIPKRLLKTAVHRNLVKRLIREGFRTMADRLPQADFVVRLTARLDPKSVAVDRKAIALELAGLLLRLGPRNPAR